MQRRKKAKPAALTSFLNTAWHKNKKGRFRFCFQLLIHSETITILTPLARAPFGPAMMTMRLVCAVKVMISVHLEISSSLAP